MNFRGRVNLLLLAVVAMLVLVGALLFTGGESPETGASKFLVALAKGDVQGVMDRTYTGKEGTEAEQKFAASYRKQWEFALNEAGKYFVFNWSIAGSEKSNDKEGSVRVDYVKNSLNPLAYSERFDLPMVNHKGKWLVDVSSMSKEFYPASPRANWVR